MAVIAVASFSALGVSLVTASNSNQSKLGNVPGGIAYQGYLTDAGGDAIKDGRHEIVFSLYEGPTIASAAWTETQSVVTTGGVFSAMLGANKDIDFIVFEKTSNLHLGIAIDGDAEATPRQQVGSVPFAILANTAGIAQDLDCNGCVTADHLAADAKNTGSDGSSSTTTLTSPNGQFQVRVTNSGIFIEGPDDAYNITMLDDELSVGGSPAQLVLSGSEASLTADKRITLEALTKLTATAGSDILINADGRMDLDTGTTLRVDTGTIFDLNAGTDVDIDASVNVTIDGAIAELDGALVRLGGTANCKGASGLGDLVQVSAVTGTGTILGFSPVVFICN